MHPAAATNRKPPAQRRRRWPPSTSAVLLLAALYAWWLGATRAPADATNPLTWHDSPHTSPVTSGRLHVATFNIHSGKGTDGRHDLDRTAAAIEGLHVVALNEVRSGFGSVENQAALLADRLGMGWLFAPAERRWWHDHFGNALLANIPVEGAFRIPLPHQQSNSYRNAVLTSLRFAETQVRVLAVHVDRQGDRQRQLRAVIDLFLSLDEPAILLGDLNSTRDDPLLQHLLSSPGVSDVVGETLGSDDPAGRIDWIVARGLRGVSAECRRTEASDHPVVCAELELIEEPRE
jgi:endonuclease/exonuclease/phosphatase family metal-dependent hydrolase